MGEVSLGHLGISLGSVEKSGRAPGKLGVLWALREIGNVYFQVHISIPPSDNTRC